MSRPLLRRLMVLIVAVITLAVLLPAGGYSQGKGNPNPRILPPHALAHGSTLGEWTARYWSWIFAFPGNYNPMIVDASIYENQPGSLFFLPNAPRTINVTIPPGRSLFIPVRPPYVSAPDALILAQTIVSNLGYDLSELTDEQVIRIATNWLADQITGLFCRINGEDLVDLEAYRIETPTLLLFTTGRAGHYHPD